MKETRRKRHHSERMRSFDVAIARVVRLRVEPAYIALVVSRLITRTGQSKRNDTQD